jgi:hypothetical protein
MFMDHIEQALSNLLKQFAELKQEFTKLLKMRGIPGPTGPAGDIHAAVIQATDVAERVGAEAGRKAVVYPFQNAVAKLREEFEALRAHLLEFTEQIENSIVIHTVKTLQEYKLLDHDCLPLTGPYAASNYPTKTDKS